MLTSFSASSRALAIAAVLASGSLFSASAQQTAVLETAALSLPAAPVAAAASAPAASAPAAASLPDAPSSSSLEAAPAPAAPAFYQDPLKSHANQSTAGIYDTVIQPGQIAPPLTFKNQLIGSFKASVAPTAVIGWLASSGLSQLRDSSPNYEQGSVARQYGQRLGAAAARSTSETVFGNGIIAPLVHQDSRYYRMGPGNNLLKRTAYAITRPLITRTNGGHQTLNIWDLGGDLSGAALTPVYYPPLNTSFSEVLQTFGGSVGGDAIGFFISEFLPDVKHAFHSR